MVTALVATFVYLHLELDRTLGYFYEPFKLPVLTVLWIGLCVFLLVEYLAHESAALLTIFGLAVGALLVKLFAFDLIAWNVNDSFIYGGDYSFRDAGLRLVDFGAVVGFLAASYAFLAGRNRAGTVRPFLGFASLGMLFIYLTLEVNTFLHQYVPGMQSGGVSILWSMFALTLIYRGIAHRSTIAPLRRPRVVCDRHLESLLRRPGHARPVLSHRRVHLAGRVVAGRVVRLLEIPRPVRREDHRRVGRIAMTRRLLGKALALSLLLATDRHRRRTGVPLREAARNAGPHRRRAPRGAAR